MKKLKRVLLGGLLSVGVICTAFGFSACKDDEENLPVNGVDGKSAYELYCQAYPEYTGTMEQWLESLKGAVGAQGEKGDKGDAGAGIASVVVDENGKLVITLTDGTVLPAIDLPTVDGGEAAESLRFKKLIDKEEYCVVGIGNVSSVDIVIPSTYQGLPVTEIADGAFENEPYVRSVEIPDSVTSIGYEAFEDCDSLTSVVIPDSVTSIGDRAFIYCDSLTSVYYKGTAEEWSDISIDWGNESLSNATIYYYSESQPAEEGNWWHYVEGVPTAWAS